MGLFSHKPRLVIIDADAMDLAEFKAKYRLFGYHVNAVLITDEAQKQAFCGDEPHGKINPKRVAQHDEMYPHVPGVQLLDYMVTSLVELTTLLPHLKPEMLLTDYHMTGREAQFPDGGVGITRAVREFVDACHDIPIVLHASEFDLKCRGPEYVEIAPLNFWITRKHDTDAYRCFERERLVRSRAKAREKYEHVGQ